MSDQVSMFEDTNANWLSKALKVWGKPHISKVYEALTAISEKDRIEIDHEKRTAKIFSSRRDKFYVLKWNEDFSAMTSIDNSALWTKKISYPMIAILMLEGKLDYDKKVAKNLEGIVWKDVNTKFKNNYDKAIEFVLEDLASKGIDAYKIKSECERIHEVINGIEIKQL